MKWIFTSASSGDIIRVKYGAIYHYGIYVSDNEVIQFGNPPDIRNLISPDDISVISSTIGDFLLGNFLEVAELNKKELKARKSTQEIISLASSRKGEKGYNIIHNNCEHFVNECVFGKHISSQVDNLRDDLKGAYQDVYIAEIPPKIKYEKLYPDERNNLVKVCTDTNTKNQRYSVWVLLRKIIETKYNLKFKRIKFTQTTEGKWTCPNFYFSLTHCNNYVAVAMSNSPIGIDLESVENLDRKGIERKILSESELAEFSTFNKEEGLKYLTKKWTILEAQYKCDNLQIIKLNHSTNTQDIHQNNGDNSKYFNNSHSTMNSTSKEIFLGSHNYIISVASAKVKSIIINRVQL